MISVNNNGRLWFDVRLLGECNLTFSASQMASGHVANVTGTHTFTQKYSSFCPHTTSAGWGSPLRVDTFSYWAVQRLPVRCLEVSPDLEIGRMSGIWNCNSHVQFWRSSTNMFLILHAEWFLSEGYNGLCHIADYVRFLDPPVVYTPTLCGSAHNIERSVSTDTFVSTILPLRNSVIWIFMSVCQPVCLSVCLSPV